MMKAFRALLKTESKIVFRQIDSILFGIAFPIGIALLLGAIYGEKPAFEGANYTFLQQSFGAIITIGIVATGLMGIPLNLADYRDRKILKKYKVSPIRPGLILLVQIIINFVIALVSSLSVYAVLSIFFDYKLEGSALGVILSYLLVTISMYGIGLMIASLSKNIKVANLVCTIIYFPMLFLSGATVPYEIMPKVVQNVMDFLPLTQGIKLLKGYSLGEELGNVTFQVGLLLIIAIVSIIISIKSFKWE